MDRWRSLYFIAKVKLTGKGVDIDEYGMTTVDLKELGYQDEPFVLVKDVTQVFYVQDMSSKPRKDKSRNKSSFVGAEDEPKRHIVPAGKRKIVGVDDVTDEEEYSKVEDMTPFAVEVHTSILLAEEEAPYASHDHNEGTIVKRTIVNIPLVEWLCLVIFYMNIIRFIMQWPDLLVNNQI